MSVTRATVAKQEGRKKRKEKEKKRKEKKRKEKKRKEKKRTDYTSRRQSNEKLRIVPRGTYWTTCSFASTTAGLAVDDWSNIQTCLARHHGVFNNLLQKLDACITLWHSGNMPC